MMRLLRFDGKATQENGKELTVLSLVIDKRLSQEEFEELRIKIALELQDLDRPYATDSDSNKT